MNKAKTPLRESESGAALIAVLVLISTVTLLVMSMATISQLATFGTRSDAARLRSAYVAEGAMNRITFLAAADASVNNTTDLSSLDYSEFEEERFLPDGVERTIDYYGTPVTFRIENGTGGLTIDSAVANALTDLTSARADEEEDLSDALTIYQTRYADYTDSDDTAGEDDGMEEADYEDIGEEPLPRNGALYCREELWWIPGGFALFPPDASGRMTLVNPIGTGASANDLPDFFQANYALLTNYAGLESDDAREVLKLLKEYRKERTVLSEVIDEDLWQTLRSRFNMTGGNIWRITIDRAAKAGSVSAKMDGTFTNPGISSTNDTPVNYFDWMVY